jgi:hypothetical protein
LALVTWEELGELPEDDLRELIDGVRVELEVPNRRHERIVADVCWLPGLEVPLAKLLSNRPKKGSA